MSQDMVTDAQVVGDDTGGSDGQGVVLVQRPPYTEVTVAPQVEAAELGKRLAVIKQAMEQEMKAGTDYGIIPGTNKPALMKPGAEKLSVLFQLDVQIENVKTYGPGDHLTVESRATVYSATTGQRLGFGEAICTSREKKYATRSEKRACPKCSEHTIFEARADAEKNRKAEFYCWRKKGGCGALFPIDDPQITSQVEGDIENPDLPDTWNTIVKMAEKRARVGAILAVTGASALFTQDLDEQHIPDNEAPAVEAGPPYGPPVENTSLASQALIDLVGADRAEGVWGELKRVCGGYLPDAVALSLRLVADAAKPKQQFDPVAQRLVDVPPVPSTDGLTHGGEAA